jgi:hypothetical protein
LVANNSDSAEAQQYQQSMPGVSFKILRQIYNASQILLIADSQAVNQFDSVSPSANLPVHAWSECGHHIVALMA